MTVSLVQTRGSRRAAGKVRHATSERTSEAGPRAGLFEAADRAVDPHAEDDGGRLPGSSRGRRASLRRCCRDERGGGGGAAVSAARTARAARPMPDWEGVAAELGKRGVTLMLV